MLKWTKALSWSKVKMLLSCPKKLQFTLEEKFAESQGPSYYRHLGTIAQYILEMYFNQKINTKKLGDSEEVIQKVITKVLKSPLVAALGTTYPAGKTELDLHLAVRKHVTMGTEMMRARNILTKDIVSEVKDVGILRGTRAYMQVDFIVADHREATILDGKGTIAANADERQLKMYAAIMMSKGILVKDAAFLYWGLGEYKQVDVSPAAVKKFLDEDWAEALRLALPLQAGVDTLEAKPSKDECWQCDWKKSCPDSLYKPPVVVTNDEVTF